MPDKYNREYNIKNKEKISQRNKKYYAEHFLKKLVQNARSRSKRNGVPFDITEDDLLPLPTHCPVLGIELTVGVGGGSGGSDSSYSIDRINNDKGYVKGNVIVISRRANKLKSDMNLETLTRLYEFYRPLLSNEQPN